MVRTYYPRCGVLLDVVIEDFVGGAGSAHTLPVVPRLVEVTKNDSRTADTCRIELDFADFPFDPRSLRSARARVFLWDAKPGAREMEVPEGQPPVFIGFVDAPEVKCDEGGDFVTLDCRDFTSVFLDFRWTDAIDLTRPLATLLESFLQAIPAAAGLRVGTTQGAVVLAEPLNRTKWAPTKGDDAWSVLTALLGQAGLTPLVDGDHLLVLTQQEFGLPWSDARSSFGPEPTRTTFVYGENLSRFSVRRNFVENRTQQVLVRCWNEAERRLSTAYYPSTTPTPKTVMGVNGKATRQALTPLPFNIAGNHSQASLNALAEQLYTELALQEMQGTLETRELLDGTGTMAVPLVANGTRIRVTLRPTLLSNIAGLTAGEATAALRAAGIQDAVASALVDAFKKAERLAVDFYVRRAVHRWHHEDGYTATIDFMNILGGLT